MRWEGPRGRGGDLDGGRVVGELRANHSNQLKITPPSPAPRIWGVGMRHLPFAGRRLFPARQKKEKTALVQMRVSPALACS